MQAIGMQKSKLSVNDDKQHWKSTVTVFHFHDYSYPLAKTEDAVDIVCSILRCYTNDVSE